MKKLKHYLASRPSSRKPFQDEDNDNMVSEMLEVDQDSCNPLRAWNRIKKTTDVQKMCPIDPKKPVKENCVRFVCIADTHNRPEKKGYDLSFLPPGDVLLHAGDFTMGGSPGEINLFNSYFGCLPHQIKILIAGNHDVSLDQWVTSPEQHQQSVELLTNFTYLEDSMVEVYGIKIYGSPWVVKCGSWGFVLQRGTPLMNRWNIIPANVDILMTHSPPLGIGDALIGDGYPGGCVDLLNTVQKRVKPKYHVYGHIHEGYGMRTDGQTVFINAAFCSRNYKSNNAPIVFDYPIPQGHTKDEAVDLTVKEMCAPDCMGKHSLPSGEVFDEADSDDSIVFS